MPQQIINYGQTMYVGMGPAVYNQRPQQEQLQEPVYGWANTSPRQLDDDLFWPSRGGMLGESAPLLIAPNDHSPRELATGGNASLGFSGITRDLNNAPLAGVTVRLFRTVDSYLVQQVVSAADGAYAVSTPYQGEDHFLVCHKSGSPEVAGASASTLEPS